MAKPKKSTQEVEKVEPYLEGVAKNLVDRLYGPQGPAWGTKLTELEDVVVAVREALSEKMLAQALARQAAVPGEQRPPAYQRCPQCGKAVTAQAKADVTEPGDNAGPPPRRVLTRAGQAQWLEPQDYCQPCRRSFFPSEQELGD
jgi:hypothetical protein